MQSYCIDLSNVFIELNLFYNILPFMYTRTVKKLGIYVEIKTKPCFNAIHKKRLKFFVFMFRDISVFIDINPSLSRQYHIYILRDSK